MLGAAAGNAQGFANSFTTVDAIDGTIPDGGGTASGTLTSQTDAGWIVFYANAGDNVSIDFAGSTGFVIIGVIFREATNGIVEVGDAANVSNFSSSQQGAGTDLIVETGGYPDAGCLSNSYIARCAGTDGTASFVASGTGQYVIGFQALDQNNVFLGDGGFSATVSGITAPAVAPTTGLAQPLGVITCLSTAVPPMVRAEGIAELVGNIVLSCTNTPPASGGSLTSYVTANISDSLNVDVTNNRDFNGAGVTDAVLVINDNHCTSPATAGSTFGSCGAADVDVQDPQLGVLGANTRLEWNQVAIPVPGGLRPGADPSQPCSAGDICFPPVTTIRLASVRANVSELGVPSGASFPSAQVTSFLSISGETSLSVTNNVLNVAVPIPGLIVETDDPIAGLQCVDYDWVSILTLTEGFATAFKTIGVPVTTPGQTQWESGYWAPGSNNGGGASQGTRFLLRFSNIPQGVEVSVPDAIEAGNSLGGPHLLIGLVEGADANGAGGHARETFSAITPVTLSSGSGSAVYEVLDTNPIANDQVQIPIYVSWESDTANDLPGIGSGQLAVSFAPLSNVLVSNAAAPEPRFIDNGGDPQTLVSIAPCTTTLLFPFVTNQSGFDTGLVIANTSDDWMLMNSEPQQGACTLHHIGSTAGGGAAPPDQTSTVIEAGQQLLWTLSNGNPAAGLAGAPDFEGYVLAVCDFQYAHGFAFITNGFGGIPTLAQGYLALVVPLLPGPNVHLVALTAAPHNASQTASPVNTPLPSLPVSVGRVPGEPLDELGHAHHYGESLSP